jgi:glycosyltransferase involved in cell wall biosynthesis
MRIALVSEHADPLAALGGEDAGGQNVHVAALAAGLADRGHDVTVYTRRDSDRSPVRVRTPQGYVVDHVAAGPAEPIPKDAIAAHLDELAASLAERWAEEPPDVIHGHFWMSGVASVAAAAQACPSAPVLETFHALGVVKQRHQGAADTSPPFRIPAERRLVRQVDRVIATCSDEVAELRAMGLPTGRASVIPCGVDSRLFRPRAARGSDSALLAGLPQHLPHRLLSLGRLVPRKGVETVIEALAGLPDTELVIAGGPPAEGLADDEEARRLRAAAERCGVADRVRFAGAVPPAEVPGLISTADLVVTAAWYEPFGIVPVEAMACGVPVVATEVGGHLDTVQPGRTGELVPPHDPEALAACLRALLADPARRRRYGEAGRARAVRDFDWRCVVERTEQVYRTTADAPTRRETSEELIS